MKTLVITADRPQDQAMREFLAIELPWELWELMTVIGIASPEHHAAAARGAGAAMQRLDRTFPAYRGES